ncbi:MAG: hypothetical protein IK132_08220 [Clostridia bacterium]|nr:hypothetical protein [Clostridia bacterium]
MNQNNTGLTKRQTAFLFTCIGGILYVVPALSALYLGVISEGWTPGFILGMAAAVLGIPNSLFAIHAYGKKRYRPLVCSFAALLIVLHLIVLPQLGSWYLILSPAIVLLVLMIVFSGVITDGEIKN